MKWLERIKWSKKQSENATVTRKWRARDSCGTAKPSTRVDRWRAARALKAQAIRWFTAARVGRGPLSTESESLPSRRFSKTAWSANNSKTSLRLRLAAQPSQRTCARPNCRMPLQARPVAAAAAGQLISPSLPCSAVLEAMTSSGESGL
jgi:hypothetical protein